MIGWFIALAIAAGFYAGWWTSNRVLQAWIKAHPTVLRAVVVAIHFDVLKLKLLQSLQKQANKVTVLPSEPDPATLYAGYVGAPFDGLHVMHHRINTDRIQRHPG